MVRRRTVPETTGTEHLNFHYSREERLSQAGRGEPEPLDRYASRFLVLPEHGVEVPAQGVCVDKYGQSLAGRDRLLSGQGQATVRGDVDLEEMPGRLDPGRFKGGHGKEAAVARKPVDRDRDRP